MSTHRTCCACCKDGDWVRPQPCPGSTAWLEYDEELELHLTKWDEGCLPRFDCQYIKEVLAEEEANGNTEGIAFAFLGACWFFNGKEKIHQSTEESLGFNLIGGTPLDGYSYDEVEEVYRHASDPCEQCMSDTDSNDEKQNERWFRFRVCECEEDFPDDGPIQPSDPGDDGPGGVGGNGGSIGDGGGGGDDFCTAAYPEDNPVYIPARYISDLMETDCCFAGTGIGGVPCINTSDEGTIGSHTNCNQPLNQCHYWKEPISLHETCTGECDKCCLKSCTPDNNPDIVTTIPYCDGITPDPGGGIINCHCLNIWTPYHLHPIHETSAGSNDWYFDREVSYNISAQYADWGTKQRGCCTCCCGQECKVPQGNWDYCAGFRGMSTLSFVVEFTDDELGGCQPSSYPCSTNSQYCCPMGVLLVPISFDLFPEVAETQIPEYDPITNTQDCILLSDTSNNNCACWNADDGTTACSGIGCIGSENDGCFGEPCLTCEQAYWDTDPVNPGSGSTYLDCRDSPHLCGSLPFSGQEWCSIIGHTSGSSACSSCETDCTGDNDPCCADNEDFCDEQPIYSHMRCNFAQGGSNPPGYIDSYSTHQHFSWGFYDWCYARHWNNNGPAVGFRIAFCMSGRFPNVQHRDGSEGGGCCENDCNYYCGQTACDPFHSALQFPNNPKGEFGCPLTFCFLMPDERVSGEDPDGCVPQGWSPPDDGGVGN